MKGYQDEKDAAIHTWWEAESLGHHRLLKKSKLPTTSSREMEPQLR